MDPSEFQRRSSDTLAAIEDAIDASGADFDYETVNDVLTLEFASGTKIIINKQSAADQIWVAARSGGFHFDYDATGDQWVCDSNGAELFAELSRLIADQSGEPISLSRD
jgi:CyaY protein